jgi:SAM-dependent methyltransferase
LVGLVVVVTVFSDIYRMNAWQGDESLSGPGSGSTATAHLAADIVAMVAELDIRSVLDVACGDGYWMPDLPGYTGIDVAPEAIELARARHPERRYLVGSAATVRLPRADLVIFRDALQHLSFRVREHRHTERCLLLAQPRGPPVRVPATVAAPVRRRQLPRRRPDPRPGEAYGVVGDRPNAAILTPP